MEGRVIIEWKDASTGLGIFLSSFVVVIGWFNERKREREFEEFKIRLAKRQEIADALSTFVQRISLNSEKGEKHFNNDQEWHRLSTLIQLYGTKKEIELLRGEMNTEQLQKLMSAIVENVRETAGYKS